MAWRPLRVGEDNVGEGGQCGEGGGGHCIPSPVKAFVPGENAQGSVTTCYC